MFCLSVSICDLICEPSFCMIAQAITGRDTPHALPNPKKDKNSNKNTINTASKKEKKLDRKWPEITLFGSYKHVWHVLNVSNEREREGDSFKRKCSFYSRVF